MIIIPLIMILLLIIFDINYIIKRIILFIKKSTYDERIYNYRNLHKKRVWIYMAFAFSYALEIIIFPDFLLFNFLVIILYFLHFIFHSIMARSYSVRKRINL